MKTGRWRSTDGGLVWLVAAFLCVLAGDAPVQESGAADREALAARSILLPTASPRSSFSNAGTTSDLFVPVILTASGASNSYYTSELTLTNRGSRTAILRYTYTAAAGGGNGTASEALAPGRQKIVSNAIDHLRALGIPIPSLGNRIGTLRVQVSGASDVGVTVRTTTQVTDGRAGLAYPGVAVADGFTEAVYLCGLRQNRQDRSNVAFQNMGTSQEGNIILSTTVFSGNPEAPGSHVMPDVTLAQGGFHQYSGLLATAGIEQGYVKVERVSGTAPFYAYGVINDQTNSDGSFVFPVAESSLAGVRGQTLPVIIEHPNFSSELIVTNFSDEAKAVDFGFVADAIGREDRTASFFLTLAAGEQRIIPEIVEELRRQGVDGLGPAGRTLAGAVFATSRRGDLRGVVIGARTGTPGGGGQYSVFYNGVPYGASFDNTAWINALQQNEENRSNLALVNTGEVDDSPSVFQLDLYDGATGMLTNTVTGLRVAARGWRQINGILGRYAPGSTQGYVRIQKISGNNPFLAYGVINDGGAPGQRSGDGAFLPPARERIIDPGTEAMTDREILEIVYYATDGPNWVNNENWLTDAPIGEWYGVEVHEGRFWALTLHRNRLKGQIPPELGSLTSLEVLWLQHNDLTGPIPAELGNLANLQELWIEYTDVIGPVPPELANLASLERLKLGNNNLTGQIPREFGAFARLRYLELARNGLTGGIPRELGSLKELEELELGHNALAGPVPPELGGMSSLKELALSNNPKLRGALPVELSELRALEGLLAAETNLCAPSDPGFQAWLAGVHKRRIAACGETDEPSAYLIQAAQSREFPVPLVAGEKALLRVFPTASRTTGEGIPWVRARFFLDGRETHVENIPGKSAPIPSEVDESSLSKSANAEIPGEVVQPGLEMVIEVDPEGTLDPELGVARRIPETGRLKVDIRAMPPFPLTVIPFLWSQKPDSLVLDIVDAMAQNPESHELLGWTRTLLPIQKFALTAHEPVISSHNTAHELTDETEAIRVLEGGQGYYMATITGERGSWHDGLADGDSHRTTFAALDGEVDRVNYVIAHELGHNLHLDHTPGCDAGGEDHSYPHANGRIGVWGYDFDSGSLVPPTAADLMSYCGPEWISDYHFTNALRYRLVDEAPPTAAATADHSRSLLVWGGVAADSVPYLEPAFLAEAPAALPDSVGDYRVIGRTGDGGELFSISFAMSATADGDGSASFAFVLPIRPGWEALASITLTGPGGAVTLDRNTNRPVTILRNPQSGQIRGILRDRTPAALDRDNAVSALVREEPGLEVLTSRGIPVPDDWTQ